MPSFIVVNYDEYNVYDNIFAKFKNDIRATCKTINEILNRTKRKSLFLAFSKMVIT